MKPLATVALLPISVLATLTTLPLSSSSSPTDDKNLTPARRHRLGNFQMPVGSSCSAVSEGAWYCMTETFQRCASGEWSAVMDCAPGTTCEPEGLTYASQSAFGIGSSGVTATATASSSSSCSASASGGVPAAASSSSSTTTAATTVGASTSTSITVTVTTSVRTSTATTTMITTAFETSSETSAAGGKAGASSSASSAAGDENGSSSDAVKLEMETFRLQLAAVVAVGLGGLFVF